MWDGFGGLVVHVCGSLLTLWFRADDGVEGEYRE